MLVLVLSLVLTGVLLVKLKYPAGLHPAELGSMSGQWVAAHQRAEPAS